jgi:hypothetical protein
MAAHDMRGLQRIRTSAPRQRKGEGEERPGSVKLRRDPVRRVA